MADVTKNDDKTADANVSSDPDVPPPRPPRRQKKKASTTVTISPEPQKVASEEIVETAEEATEEKLEETSPVLPSSTPPVAESSDKTSETKPEDEDFEIVEKLPEIVFPWEKPENAEVWQPEVTAKSSANKNKPVPEVTAENVDASPDIDGQQKITSFPPNSPSAQSDSAASKEPVTVESPVAAVGPASKSSGAKYRSPLAQKIAEKYGISGPSHRSRSHEDVNNNPDNLFDKEKSPSSPPTKVAAGKQQQASAASATAKMMKGAHERGENLSRLEDASARLEQNASEFGSLARQLAEREKDKKWYEF